MMDVKVSKPKYLMKYIDGDEMWDWIAVNKYKEGEEIGKISKILSKVIQSKTGEFWGYSTKSEWGFITELLEHVFWKYSYFGA